jgi:hypothetical protein
MLSPGCRAWSVDGSPQILSFFVTGHTNAKSEARNLITERLRRIGPGFRNLENYRLRLSRQSGVQWNTRPTARMHITHAPSPR